MKIKRNINSGDISSKQGQLKFQKNIICKLHNQNCDLICLKDGKNICYNCALFGNHKGHQVQTCEIFFKKLLQHQKQIFNISKSINQSKQYKSKFYELKQNLKIEQIHKTDKVKEAFRSLIVQIKIKQKQCIKKIQKEYSQIEATLKIEEEKLSKKLQKYQQNTIWPDLLNKLNEQSKLKEPCQLFLCDQMFLTDQKRNNFLQIGKKIEYECKRQFQRLQKEMATLINSIDLNFQSPSCKSIFIQNWCQISRKKQTQQQDLSEYFQQDSQFYLLSSVKSIQNFQQKKDTFINIQKQLQEEQCLLNSIRAEQMEQQNENNIQQKVSKIANVSFAVLKQVHLTNQINIKANHNQKQNQKQKKRQNKKIMQKNYE